MAVLAKGRFFAAAAFAALTAAGAAHAAGKCGNDASGFNAWVGAYTADAKARGIDTRPLQGVKYDTGVIKIDRAQHKAFRGSLEDFDRAATAIPEVQTVQHVLGLFDYRLRVTARDLADFERVLRRRIMTLPGVGNVEANVLLSEERRPGPLG